MSLKSICLSLFLILKSFVAFSQEVSSSDSLVNKDHLLMHLKTLSSDAFEGREAGTPGGIKTRKYIINQFYSLGVQPLGKTFEQPFFFINQRNQHDAANILGWIKGSENPESYIVISAHFDHVGIKNGQIYNGADDNASGVSALFAFAEYFKKNPPKHSVILAAFDGEEFDLKGSKFFVKNTIIPLNNIKLNLNMDMISRSEKNELFVVGTRYNDYLKQLLSHFKTTEAIKLSTGHNGDNQQENWTYSSDHASFYKKDIPFLYFGVDDHEDYHQPTDDYENIQPAFYLSAVKTILSVFNRIDHSMPN